MGFKLTWIDPNLAEDGHRVYRDTSPIDRDSPPTPIADLPANSTQYIDGDVVAGNTYYYAVGAYISGGAERVSSSLEVEAVEPDIETPYSIAGLVHWLSAREVTPVANGDPINATWADRSSASNEATQSTVSKRPTYLVSGANGQPGLSFTSTTEMEFVASAPLPGNNASTTLYLIIQGSAQDTSNITTLYGNGRAGCYFRDDGNMLGVANVEGGQNRTSEPLINNTPQAIYISSTGAEKLAEVYYNGTAAPIASGANAIIRQNNWIGGYPSTDPSYTGLIYEALVFDRELTLSERQQLDTWASNLYGMQMGSD